MNKNSARTGPRTLRRALVYGYNTIKDARGDDFETLFKRSSKARINQLVISLVGQTQISLPSDVSVSQNQSFDFAAQINSNSVFIQDPIQ